MSSTLFGVVVLTAILLAGVTLGLLSWLGMRARHTRQLERRLLGNEVIRDEFDSEQASDAIKTLARGGQRVEKWVDRDGETGKLLLQAGWRGARNRMLFYAFRGGLLLLAGLLSLLMWMLGGDFIQPYLMPMYTFGLLAVAFLLPLWVLRALAKSRRERIAREVPLFIHLLVLLFEAGLSSRQAFANLVREGRGVLPQLGIEFEVVLRQLEAGGEVNEVLRNLANTLEVSDLEGVLGILRQVEKYGGEIRDPLMDALSVLEERRSLSLREQVNLISGRMTVVMVTFFFPALLIFVAGPAVMSIMKALSSVGGK